MKSFTKWAEENKLELPAYTEDIRRTIAHWAYPGAAGRDQYTPSYFMAGSADAIQKLGPHAKPIIKGPKYKLPPE